MISVMSQEELNFSDALHDLVGVIDLDYIGRGTHGERKS